MSQVSPPKPWERTAAGVVGAGAASSLTPSTLPSALPSMSSTTTAPASTPAAPSATASTPSSTTAPPAIPPLPSSISSGAVGPYSSLNRGTYGMNTGLGSTYGSYGTMGGYSSYTSPYSRYGMGGMGGMYGGMGSYGGYGGMGGMGGYGGYPMGGDPNDPNSFMRGMEASTATTFQMIESIVQAFGGFAQMLESTYMATHSSFFAMVRVAEQFGNLKNTLGSILGIFTIIRWVRTLAAKLTGRPLPASAADLTAANFAHFEGRPGAAGAPRPSKKPFIFFVVAVFGLPYLMGKLIKSLAAKQEEADRRRAGEVVTDPSQLEFCRVMFDFTPEQPNGVELEVKKGDLVAVLSKADPMGNPSQWWRCRARDSRVGYLPSPYLESIVRKDLKQIAAGTESRTMSLTSESAKAALQGKAGDITIESFQKSQFNSA